MSETVKSASVPAPRESVETTDVKAADYTQTVDMTRHVKEHHQGHKVDFTVDTDTQDDVSGQFDDRLNKLIDGKIKDVMANREARENVRANHRNKNRLLTLAGAIIIGIIVTYFFQNDGFPLLGWHHVMPAHTAVILYGYSFVVTVTLDASLALYSYIKHY